MKAEDKRKIEEMHRYLEGLGFDLNTGERHIPTKEEIYHRTDDCLIIDFKKWKILKTVREEEKNGYSL